MLRALHWNANSYMVPVAASVLVHGLVVLFVTWGWESAELPKQRVTPKYVEAKLVTVMPEAAKPKAAPPKPKVVDLAARKREQQAAADRKKRLAMEKAERERLRKEAEAKRKKEAEQARQKKQREEQQRLERERLARERERQQELERQRQQEAAFADALSEEQELLMAEQSSATRQGYIAAIAERIEHNWSRPPSARLGMKCELRIQLVPTGDVVNVTVIKSSGNSAFDRSAEQAVNKVGRFDVLKGMPPEMFEQYFRQFTLVFNPQDLRQ